MHGAEGSIGLSSQFNMLAHAIVMIIAFVAGLGAQHPKPVRVFAYDPLALEAFNKEQAAKLSGENSEAAATEAQVKPSHKPEPNPTSYVSVSGNFGGVFNVNGIGGSTTQTETNWIDVTSNRSLTFTANSFKPLQMGSSDEAVLGTVKYSMALYQGNSAHVGTMLAGPVSGTDGSFNGQSLSLNVAQIPSGGNLVLMISRTLTLTAMATGACTLVGTGNIGVTIN
jgi:hypothetical protein